jgi:hypothetical protein
MGKQNRRNRDELNVFVGCRLCFLTELEEAGSGIFDKEYTTKARISVLSPEPKPAHIVSPSFIWIGP